MNFARPWLPSRASGPVQAADQLPAAGRQRDPDLAPVDRVALPLHITLPLEPVEQRRRCGTREASGLRELACGHPRLAEPVEAPEIRRVQAELPPDFVVEAVCRPLVGLGGPADGSEEVLTLAGHLAYPSINERSRETRYIETVRRIHRCKALIVGGGVAGTVTAMALQQVGIEAAIFESHPPSDGELGSYFTLTANGLEGLAAIGAATSQPPQASRRGAMSCGTRPGAGWRRCPSTPRCRAAQRPTR